jgi:hypothetical protein
VILSWRLRSLPTSSSLSWLSVRGCSPGDCSRYPAPRAYPGSRFGDTLLEIALATHLLGPILALCSRVLSWRLLSVPRFSSLSWLSIRGYPPGDCSRYRPPRAYPGSRFGGTLLEIALATHLLEPILALGSGIPSWRLLSLPTSSCLSRLSVRGYSPGDRSRGQSRIPSCIVWRLFLGREHPPSDCFPIGKRSWSLFLCLEYSPGDCFPIGKRSWSLFLGLEYSPGDCFPVGKTLLEPIPRSGILSWSVFLVPYGGKVRQFSRMVKDVSTARGFNPGRSLFL